MVTSERNATFLAADPQCEVCFPDDVGHGCGGLGLTDDQIFTSNAVGLAGASLLRLVGGPLIDRFGVKR
jgi:hypothetical protein